MRRALAVIPVVFIAVVFPTVLGAGGRFAALPGPRLHVQRASGATRESVSTPVTASASR